MKAFIVAGEHSGDQLGRALMAALRVAQPDITFEGVGGPAMESEGLASLFPLSDIAVMGFTPVLRRLPTVLARIAATARAVVAAQPDVLILIDSPDFTHRVAARARHALPHLRVVDYVSPTVWAWRPGRAKAMTRIIDHVLALLPFEPAAHARLGGPACTYVGHPLIERLDVLRGPRPPEDGPPLLLVLPGSRRTEIERLTPDFGAAVARVAQACGLLDVALPAVGHLEGLIRQRVAGWPTPPCIVLGEAAKFAAFRRARAALAASGTVTLELALAGVPMVVAYRVSRVEELLRFVVTAPSIVLPNLILGDRSIPELLQHDCTPQALADALIPLLGDTPARAAQLAALQRLDALMRLDDGDTPSARAARIVLEVAGAAHSG